jgi:hypothetical protein
MRVALLGLLLSAAALCGFGCWAIRELVTDAHRIAADSDLTVKAATDAESRIGALAANANGLLAETKPRIAETLGRANETLANLDTASVELKRASAGVDMAVTEINRPCSGDADAPCGTIATANRALNSVRLAAGQVTDVSLKERAQLKAANEQETAIASATQADLVKLGVAIDGVGALAANKDLLNSFQHADTTLGAVSGMATETAQAWHNTLHPKWPKRVWTAATGVGLTAAKFFF